jgi:hypothetical protein
MALTSDFAAVLVRRKDKAAVLSTSSTKLTMHATIRSLVMKLNFCGGFSVCAVPSGVGFTTISPGMVYIPSEEFMVNL